MARHKGLRFSKSSLGLYLECPRQYYYNNHPEVPKRVDHPRLCGSLVHSFVKTLYRPTKEPRPFYFKEKKSFLTYWWFKWPEEIQKALDKGLLSEKDADKDQKFGAVGTTCLSNYWDANVNLPRPFQVEKAYRATLWDFPLIGIFDQVRSVSVEWIQRHRPELVSNGCLNEAYSPALIVDLKTEYESFDASQFKENPTLEETIRQQFELHEGIQATLYTLLYEVVTGKKPVAFAWYHLPSNKWFVTWRENRDYDTLYGILRHCRDNIAAESFPKNVGRKRCKRCDYWDICREDRYFIISRPELPGESKDKVIETVPNLVSKESNMQLRFKLSVERRKSVKPAVIVPHGPPVLRELPWDETLMPAFPKK